MTLRRHRPALVVGWRCRCRPTLRPGMDRLYAKSGILPPRQPSRASLRQAKPLLHGFRFLPAQELGSLEPAERVEVIAKHKVLGRLLLAIIEVIPGCH